MNGFAKKIRFDTEATRKCRDNSFHEFNVICARCHVRSYFPEIVFCPDP